MATTPPDPDKLAAALKAAFPDADVANELPGAMSEAVHRGDAISSTATAKLPSPPQVFSDSDAAIGYYAARGVHRRVGGTHSVFEGILPQVRVRLPDKGGMELIETGLGLLIPQDRKILSAAQVKPLVGRTAARVELITAPRLPDAKGSRFGAIALYLCYERVNDRAPSFYILEAGTATGQPKVLFYGKAMGTWIKNQHTAYQPTPFSSPKNYYNGVLRMREDNPNEPHSLIVEGRPSLDAPWYIQVTTTYQILERPPVYKPLSLILEAAARVGMVGKALNFDTDASIDIATALFGESLDWMTKPGE